MAAAATEAVGQEPAVTQVSLADSEPAHVNTANSFGDLESATQMCLLPHARETQRPSIHHGVCVCVREKASVSAGTLICRMLHLRIPPFPPAVS